MEHEQNYVAELKGFDDYIEIVKVGEHVAMNGETVQFTEADLDQMVANTKPNTAPFVIGHPKTNTPAWGWGLDYKRIGDSAYVKGGQIDPQFAAMVKEGKFKKRSVRVAKGKDGWVIKHIGWLGAAAPAIEGMADVEFAADESAVELEFSVAEAISEVGYMFNSVGNFIRSMREAMIVSNGIEAADKYFPEYMIAGLQTASETLRTRMKQNENDFAASDDESLQAAFAEELAKTITADLAAATQQSEAELQFAAREKTLRDENIALQAQITRQALEAKKAGWLQSGKLTPATSIGIVDFMAALPDTAFDFSAGDGTVNTDPAKYFSQFIENLPAIQLGQEQAGGTLPESPYDFSNPLDVELAAKAYQKEQHDKGVSISWTDACVHVAKGQSH